MLLGSWLGPASAASTDWVIVEGGRVRLVTAGGPTRTAPCDGALEIALEPGWKTYWRDPGDAGVPPQIDIGKSTNVADVAIEFPTPERFADGTTSWAGYKHPVAFPLRFKPGRPGGADGHRGAMSFLGICESICVPVQATLQPSIRQQRSGQRRRCNDLVAAAALRCPPSERPDFRRQAVGCDDKR